MQDLMRIEEERSKAEEAKGFLDDAYVQMDALELQMNRMASKMKKVATGLHFAIQPNHEVSQTPTPILLWPCDPPLTAPLVYGAPDAPRLCLLLLNATRQHASDRSSRTAIDFSY